MRIRVRRRSSMRSKQCAKCGSGSRTDAINFLWCRLGQAVPSLAHSHTTQAGRSEWASKTEREREQRQAGSARQTAAWPSALAEAMRSMQRQRQRQSGRAAEGESFNRPQQTCNFIRMSVETARDRVKSSVEHWKKGRSRRGGAAARRGKAGRQRQSENTVRGMKLQWKWNCKHCVQCSERSDGNGGQRMGAQLWDWDWDWDCAASI